MAKVTWNVRDVNASLEEVQKRLKVTQAHTKGYDDCPAYVRDTMGYIFLILTRAERAAKKLQGKLPKAD